MAVTTANLITTLDSYTGDASTDRVTQAERLDALTEAVVWTQESTGMELQNFTYDFNYYDTVHTYNVTSILSDIIMASDLRRMEGENNKTFNFTSGKQISEDIANGSTESSFTIERYDRKAYIVVNHDSKYQARKISGFENTTDGGGTWTLDSSTSDAVNLTVDSVNFNEGNASLKFDADVSQSGNNKIGIYNSTLTSLDLTEQAYLSGVFVDIYFPAVTYISSVTITWGTDTSNYWSATATTDAFGASFAASKWNKIKVTWDNTTTTTGTPDYTDVAYFKIEINYTGSQADQTGYGIDNLMIVRPEKLKLHYLSTYVGRDTGGSSIQLFGATTDTPYFSGLYDQMKYAVAHYAAGIIFENLRLGNEAEQQFQKASAALLRVSKMIPSSKQTETRSFKPMGINFTRRK